MKEGPSFTIAVVDGKPAIQGPLKDRELCLRLISEGLRLLLSMPREDKQAVEVPPPEFVPGLLAAPPVNGHRG